MRMLFVVFVWMGSVRIVMLYFFVICVIWLCIRSVMGYFIFLRVSGFVVIVCSFGFVLWIVCCV